MLEKIDFSKSISSSPINRNFEFLNESIKTERLSVGGYGISHGLENEIDGMTVFFESGHVVLKDGSSLDIDETHLEIELPELTTITQELVVMNDGTIFLSHVPYNNKGTSVTNLEEIFIWLGDIKIKARTLIKNRLTIPLEYVGKMVSVTYQYALSRIDTVYINEKNQLDVIKGTSALTPSIRETDYFTILYIKINPYCYYDAYYTCGLQKCNETAHYRNIYTDSNNKLYMYGELFTDLGIVHFSQPDFPKPNTLWYHAITNKLYIYQDGWQAVGDRNFTEAEEYQIFLPEENPSDLQTFIFHNTDELGMKFVPGKNELRVMVAQYPLFYDQYEEITYDMALNDPKLHTLLQEKGYSLHYDTELASNYENTGIGFRLKMPMLAPDFVQASVTHRVVDASFQTRYQRSATFIKKGYVNLSKSDTSFHTHVPFRADECQLEVFSEDRILFEHFDYEEAEAPRGSLITEVKLIKPLPRDMILHYKITSNVYSYDHVMTLLENQQEAGVVE